MFGIEINLLAVLVAGVLNMIIGALWYGPIFGKIWMQLVGKTEAEISTAGQNDMIKTYGVTFINALISAYVLAHIVGIFYQLQFDRVPATSFDLIVLGLKSGFWMWFGFVATTMLTNNLFERKSYKLWGVNAGYWLLTLLTVGAVIALWR